MPNIKIIIDPDTFQASPSSMTGQIWLHHDDKDFPGAQWDDFVVVVLGWWLDEGCALFAGHKDAVRWRFMDGPWWVDLERAGDKLRLRFVDDHGKNPKEVGTTEVDARGLMAELVRAADVVIDRCAALKWSTGDLETLQRNRRALAALAT